MGDIWNKMSDAMSNERQLDVGEAQSEGISTSFQNSQSAMSKKKRNQVANTPMARAKYADKAPKINLRKSYPE